MGDERHEVATIASDEDMDTLFVLADERAPTAEAARNALLAQAPDEWGVRIGLSPDDPALVPTRKWYRPVTEREIKENGYEDWTIIGCPADDPRKESEWWVFDGIAPGDLESA